MSEQPPQRIHSIGIERRLRQIVPIGLFSYIWSIGIDPPITSRRYWIGRSLAAPAKYLRGKSNTQRRPTVPIPTRNDLTAEEVRRLFHYDPDTGVLTWKSQPDKRREWNTCYAGKEAGYIYNRGARLLQISGRRYLAHRVIFLIVVGRWPEEIDHINRNPADNRWANLRESTRSQNLANRGLYKNNKSGFTGVTPTRCGRFRATIEEAAEAYRKATVEIHGDFGREVS